MYLSLLLFIIPISVAVAVLWLLCKDAVVVNGLARRHNDSIVCLDRDSQELVLRNTTQNSNGNGLELTDCPYCHRPIREDHAASSTQDTRRGNPGAQAEFVNPNYFRMLQSSLPSSGGGSVEAGSSSSRRRRRLYQQPALPGLPTGSSDLGSSSSSSLSSHAGTEESRARRDSSQGISSGAFTQGYFKKFFVEESVLGRGGKGVVLLVKHVLDGVSLGYYACKRVPVGDDHEWLEKVLGEVQLLQHLSHQNLVSYRHVWLEDATVNTFGPSVPCAFILQQYCNAGDLHNYICGSVQTSTTAQQLKDRLRRKSRGRADPGPAGPRMLQFDEIYSFFKDITSGLRYLHANGYIHRDLKPNNCLLSQDSDGIRVLVSDFGEVQSQNAMRRSTGTTGTISYCAPEVLRREYPDGPFANFTFKSDIFSLGMILYFLCFAELPYINADIINEELEDLDRLRDEINHWTGFDTRRRLRPDLPEKLYVFLERLLSVDPSRRPSADEVLHGIQAGANANAGDSFRYRRASPTSPSTAATGAGESGLRIQPVDNQDQTELSLSPRKSLSSRRGSTATVTATTTTSAIDAQTTATTADRNLIVRPRFNGNDSTTTPTQSPTRAIHTHDQHQHQHDSVESPPRTPSSSPGSHAQQRRHLLPPPPPPLPGRFPFLYDLLHVFGLSYYSRWRLSLPFIQLSLFLVKAVFAFHPCIPLAVNPWAFYPLLILAVVTLRTRSLLVQVLTTLVHLLVVFVCFRLGGLCVDGHSRHTRESEYILGL